jgi:hypothetical protein
VHLQVARSNDNNANPNFVIAMLVFDHHPQGTTVTESDIFAPATTNALAFNNLNNRKRFTVLASRKLIFGQRVASVGDTADKQHQIVKLYRSIKGRGGTWMSEFNGTNGTIGETRSGALYLILRADTSGTGTSGNGLDYVFQSRVRFDD